MTNYIKISMPANSKNEALARSIVGAFATELPFTLEDINDIKTAVSEAVTNAIVHGLLSDGNREFTIVCKIIEQTIEVKIIDNGVGIKNVAEAMQPFYTSKPDDERSGMGFTIMSTFMDNLKVESKLGEGTTVTFCKSVKNV